MAFGYFCHLGLAQYVFPVVLHVALTPAWVSISDSKMPHLITFNYSVLTFRQIVKDKRMNLLSITKPHNFKFHFRIYYGRYFDNRYQHNASSISETLWCFWNISYHQQRFPSPAEMVYWNQHKMFNTSAFDWICISAAQQWGKRWDKFNI